MNFYIHSIRAGILCVLAFLALPGLVGPLTAWGQDIGFTYQGRVTSGGNAFNGTGQFKFALVTSTNTSREATATAVLSGAFVVEYNVTFSGSGYLTPPTVTVSGGGGSGAAAHAVVTGGVITDLVPDSAGSGYTSPPTVTIAPPPPSISFTTFWSNDGTGTDGGEPVAAVSVPISNGLFTVVLGDTTLPNMTALDASVFGQPKLQLRIWFNDGVNGFAPLNPPQELTPTPYAVRLLGTLPASQVTGALSSTGLNGAYSGAVNFSNASNSFSGAFDGNGGALSNLSVNALAVIATNVSISTWGLNQFGERNVPDGLGEVVEVAAGYSHSLALKPDGTVAAWGAGTINDPDSFVHRGQSIVPGNLRSVTAVAAGTLHSLALKSDGTVVAWGLNDFGQTNVPGGLTDVAAISGGFYHNLALKRDGTVVVWGTNSNGQLNLPPGLNNVREIAAGVYHNLALRNDGTVVAWGAGQTNDPATGTDFGQSIVPAGLANVVAIAAGGLHSLALKGDGTVVAWGAGKTNAGLGLDFGQSIVPAGLNNVVAIVAGYLHSVALKSDGTVVAWGDRTYRQTDVPSGLNNVLALARGSAALHALALRKRASAPVAVLDSDNTFNGNVDVNGNLGISGDIRLDDGNLWFRAGNDQNNGLGWHGAGKPFGGVTAPAPDGPVLFGAGGGGLGTSSNNQQKIALAWDASQRVGIGTTTPRARLSLGSDSAASKLLLVDAGGNSTAGLGFTNSQFRLHLPGSGRFAFFDAPNGGNELLSVYSGSGFLGGQVGIGTNGPTAKLHVNGNIRMGPNAYYAAGGTENLRIIRGTVSSTGSPLEGTDFTVTRVSAGVYQLTFSPAFIFAPSVTANAQTTAPRVVSIPSVNASGAGIRIFFMDLNPADVQFSFIAVGQR